MTDNFVPRSFPFFSPHFHFEVAKGRTIRKVMCVGGGGGGEGGRWGIFLAARIFSLANSLNDCFLGRSMNILSFLMVRL